MIAVQDNATAILRRSKHLLTMIGEAAAPSVWADHLASALSQIASPPVLTVLMVGLCAVSLHQTDAWRWAVVYVVLNVAAPIGYLVWLVLRGAVSDLDVQQREERARPMIAALVGAAASMTLLRLGSAPQLMCAIAGATFLELLLIFFVTLRWKISVHTSAASAFVTLVWGMIGVAAMPALLLIPLIAWARVRLRRHTPAQAVAGALWGSLCMMLVLYLVQRG